MKSNCDIFQKGHFSGRPVHSIAAIRVKHTKNKLLFSFHSNDYTFCVLGANPSFCLLKLILVQYLLWSTCQRVDYLRFGCLFDFIRPRQQFFSYVGTGLPGLNQY